MKRGISLILAALFSMGSWSSPTERPTARPVRFETGQSSFSVRDSLKGDQFIDYAVRGKAGQTLRVKLKSSNSSNYFNVLPPDNHDALFVGSIEGNEWTAPIHADGIYTVRVYLMRNAARRGEQAQFTLTIDIASNEK